MTVDYVFWLAFAALMVGIIALIAVLASRLHPVRPPTCLCDEQIAKIIYEATWRPLKWRGPYCGPGDTERYLRAAAALREHFILTPRAKP